MSLWKSAPTQLIGHKISAVWKLVFTKKAQKDAKNLQQAGLRNNAENLLKIIEMDPFANPPRFEKLVGNLSGAYSRRITIQHRLVYQVIEQRQTVKILRMWSHYE